MDTVIPPDVLAQLQELHDERNSTAGWWRTEQLANAMGCGAEKARKLIRAGVRAGHIERQRFSLTDAEAAEHGLISGCSVQMYRWEDDARESEAA